MANVVITTRMILGDDPSPLPDVVRVLTAEDACLVVSRGMTAQLPAGEWSMARDALYLLGAERSDIDNALEYARFGGILEDF